MPLPRAATRTEADGPTLRDKMIALVDPIATVVDTIPDFLFAPAGTSQADLQAKVTLAQTSGKPLYLGAGDFNLTGITTSQSFDQPNIFGLGMRYTVVTCTTSGAAFTFVGGSGQMNGGSLNNMTLTGANSTGVKLSACNGIRLTRIRFKDMARGVLFINGAAGSFTEFNVCYECVFDSTVPVHIEYDKSLGFDSFHGSGFRDCLFVQSATASGPIIKVGAGARVYNAPWDGTIFAQASAPLILVSSTLQPIVGGFLRIEGGLIATSLVDPTSASAVYYTGGVTRLSETTTFGDKFRLADFAGQNADGTVTVQLRPYGVQKTLASGATVLLPPRNPGAGALVWININAPNYEQNHLLYFYSLPSSAGGTVNTIVYAYNLDGVSAGPPVYSVNGSGQLVVTNNNYTSNYKAHITVQEAGMWPLHPLV